MIKERKFNQLMHDIKRASKVISIIRDEEDSHKRGLIADLLKDELDRLVEDLQEAKKGNGVKKDG